MNEINYLIYRSVSGCNYHIPYGHSVHLVFVFTGYEEIAEMEIVDGELRPLLRGVIAGADRYGSFA